MQYRTVKKTGDQISALSFGCLRFPMNGNKIDYEPSVKMLRHAIDQGVNYLDTAYPYQKGDSEVFIGKALKDGYREKVKIATKLPLWKVKSREDMDRILTHQLVKLQVDTIDYYLLHMLMGTESWERMKSIGVIEFLEDAKAAGKINHIGFSYHGNGPEFIEIVDDYDWVMAQIQFNYLDTNTQAGLGGLKHAASKDIAVMVMEPLRGGNLANKVPKEGIKLFYGSGHDWSPAAWSFRWILNFEEVTTVLSGMNTMEQIDENLNTACETIPNSFSNEDQSIVEQVKSIFETKMKVACTACGYCMPCPAGVNIPMCFAYYNEKYLFDKKSARWMYLNTLGGFIGDKKSLASQCISCGKCEKVCPQHIKISDEMTTISKEYEGFIYKIMQLVGKFILRIRKKTK